MSELEGTIELVLGLLVVVTVLTALARRIHVAYPLVLVIGGLVMAWAPQIPDVELHPDLVMVLFLPPLLFADALGSSWRELRAEARPLGSLAVGLVLATALGVGTVAHALIPGMPWSCALVLGAVLSPTDAVAAGAIAHQLHLPRRLLTLVQGEALVNDASGLVVYQFAVAAVVAGTFSARHAGERFAYVVLAGVAIGLVIGFLICKLQRWFDEPVVAILFLVLGAYAAYLPAEQVHASGVLAVVAAGLYVARNAMPALPASTRLTASSVLQMVTFLINGLVFILLGMQLSTVTAKLAEGAAHHLFFIGLLIALATVVVRFAWVFIVGLLGQLRSRRDGHAAPGWREKVVLTWSGMRGVVSLAVALALPLTTQDGTPFPFRDELIFVAFVAIVATLLVQGISLATLIKKLGVAAHGDEELVNRSRRAAVEAAQRRLGELASRANPEELVQVRRALDVRLARIEHAKDAKKTDQIALLDLLGEMMQAQRAVLKKLRDEGEIPDQVIRDLEVELDLQEVSLLRQ